MFISVYAPGSAYRHVVNGARSITVVTGDGTHRSAEPVGGDPETDPAAIRISAPGLPAIPFGDSSAIRVAQTDIRVRLRVQHGSLTVIRSLGLHNIAVTTRETAPAR